MRSKSDCVQVTIHSHHTLQHSHDTHYSTHPITPHHPTPTHTLQTVKYLYLSFVDAGALLDYYVLSTEGHIMPSAPNPVDTHVEEDDHLEVGWWVCGLGWCLWVGCLVLGDFGGNGVGKRCHKAQTRLDPVTLGGSTHSHTSVVVSNLPAATHTNHFSHTHYTHCAQVLILHYEERLRQQEEQHVAAYAAACVGSGDSEASCAAEAAAAAASARSRRSGSIAGITSTSSSSSITPEEQQLLADLSLLGDGLSVLPANCRPLCAARSREEEEAVHHTLHRALPLLPLDLKASRRIR